MWPQPDSNCSVQITSTHVMCFCFDLGNCRILGQAWAVAKKDAVWRVPERDPEPLAIIGEPVATDCVGSSVQAATSRDHGCSGRSSAPHLRRLCRSRIPPLATSAHVLPARGSRSSPMPSSEASRTTCRRRICSLQTVGTPAHAKYGWRALRTGNYFDAADGSFAFNADSRSRALPRVGFNWRGTCGFTSWRGVTLWATTKRLCWSLVTRTTLARSS